MKVLYKQGETRFIIQLVEDKFVLMDLQQNHTWYSEYADTWLRGGYWDEVTEQPDETIMKQLEVLLIRM